MLNNKIFTFFTLIFVVATQSFAINISKQMQPESISDEQWFSLKSIVQEAELIADDASSSSEFGISVSLSGNRALIGAQSDDEHGSQAGSAYVFEFNSGTWSQVAKLVSLDIAAGDRFGTSVSLLGDHALIGAPFTDGFSVDSGSAYVFEYDGVSWSQTAELNSINVSGERSFGSSVSLSVDRALIGTPNHTDPVIHTTNIGAAYIFDFSGGVWSQTAELVDDNAKRYDRFGNSVSLSGDRALIGVKDDEVGDDSLGSAHIFELNAGNWEHVVQLNASDAAVGDDFGHAVFLLGDRAVISAPRHDDVFMDDGSVYVFELDTGNWSQTEQLIAVDSNNNQMFGNSLSLYEDKLLIGANGDDENGGDSGAAYVYDFDGLVWSQTTKLIGDNTATSEWFGYSVSISANLTLIGAPLINSSRGSAYIINLDSGLIFKDGFED